MSEESEPEPQITLPDSMNFEELSPYDARILKHLYENPGDYGQNIAKASGRIHSSNFTYRIKKLEEWDLVTREEDGRTTHNYLTDNGKYLAKRFKEIIECIEDGENDE